MRKRARIRFCGSAESTTGFLPPVTGEHPLANGEHPPASRKYSTANQEKAVCPCHDCYGDDGTARSGLNITIANGGRVMASDHGRPKAGVFVAGTAVAFPALLPP